MRRERARRPDPRAALGRDRRAHPRLQHGLPEVRACEAIGGFDPQFRIAGDDVDICWRLQEQGWTVGFSPGAVVWHHRRDSRARLPQAAVRVRQGRGAARAQVARALQPRRSPRLGRPRLRQRARRAGARAAPLEDLLRHLGHRPLPVRLPARARRPRLAAADAGVVPGDRRARRRSPRSASSGRRCCSRCRCSLAGGRRARRSSPSLGGRDATFCDRAPSSRFAQLPRCALVTALLYMLQPAARLGGRLRFGLAPWRRRSAPRLALPRPAHQQRLERALAVARRAACAASRRRCAGSNGVVHPRRRLRALGPAGPRRHARRRMRMRMAVEEHGAGRQLVRFRSWPRFSRIGAGVALVFAALARGRRARRSWLDRSDRAGRGRAADRGLDDAGLRDRRRRPDASRSPTEAEHAQPGVAPRAERARRAAGAAPAQATRLRTRRGRSSTRRTESRERPRGTCARCNGVAMPSPLSLTRRAGLSVTRARGVRLRSVQSPMRTDGARKQGEPRAPGTSGRARPEILPYLRPYRKLRGPLVLHCTVLGAVVGARRAVAAGDRDRQRDRRPTRPPHVLQPPVRRRTRTRTGCWSSSSASGS